MSKKIFLFTAVWLFFFQAQALLQFDIGTYELEGYLTVQNKTDVFLTINRNTDNETNFKLSGKLVDGLKSKDNHKVVAVIKVDKSVFSYIGTAELIEIKKYNNGFYDVKVYQQETELTKIKTKTAK